MSGDSSEWFATWFNSPLYHQLYKHRDDSEAHAFIDALIGGLRLDAGARVLDLACGRGRYAKYLNSKGFDVTGIDLSPNSIEYARNFEQNGLTFQIHDMREPIEGDKFDYILNLFTSFGYFRSKKEDEAVLRAAHSAVKQNGLLVIDYINCEKAVKDLNAEETVIVDDVRFDIARWVADGSINKRISVEKQEFTEEVKVLYLEDFREYAETTRFTIDEVYGNYKLQPFQNTESERMIMIFKPK
jgi:SAM-dependent methyltransferase